MTQPTAIDDYFADCVRCVLASRELPVFPRGLAEDMTAIKQGLDYHGIALLIAQGARSLPDWPADLANAMQDQARLQAIWEADHAAAIAQLIENLHSAGHEPLVMKGSALAYSVYSDPAVRRRGDTDLLIESSNRAQVRRLFERSGFEPSSNKRQLQEDWLYHSPAGFTHHVDLHWAVSSSMVISAAIERDHPRARSTSLPRLSPNAQCMGPLDTFIQICINRRAHAAFGYHAKGGKILEGDRLIWAIDLHKLAAGFSPLDWSSLKQIADRWGATDLVVSGIDFTHAALANDFAARFDEQSGDLSASKEISAYFDESSARRRLKADLASTDSLPDKLGLMLNQLFPGRDFMQSRYPEQTRWPLPALYMRRLLDGTARMLLGRSS